MKEKLKEGLMPLYAELPFDFNNDTLSMFCVQWGKFYPQKKKEIMFVGKAVNGWHTIVPVNIAFSQNEEQIFDCGDQMNWVSQPDPDKYGYLYQNHSAFWRIIRNVSELFYPQEDWFENVSWNNLYKIAPKKGGNPMGTCQKSQIECCKKILSKEIEVLNPKLVVMLTSGWENDFIYYLNGNMEPVPLEIIEWDQHQTTLYKINGTAFITSQHPQGKSELKHTEAIQALIKKHNLL